MHHAFSTRLALALLLAACGGGGGRTTSSLPPDIWTWVDVTGTACSDGSPTGLAVKTAPEGSTDHTVLVFLMGGGACWGSGGYACPGEANAGPFGGADFNTAVAAGLDQGTILDRTVPGTPFAGATLVFVPYCTGDVHWGDSEQTYPTYDTVDHLWHHAGKANLEADVAWLVHHLGAPEKLVVAGSSAGGYGSLLAFDLLRAKGGWPGGEGYLVDDSGPPLVGSDLPSSYLTGWYESWNLDASLGPVCGDACKTDLSQVISALRVNHPTDRIAYAGSLEDVTLANFLGYGLATGDYEDALLRLVNQSFATTSTGAHAFLAAGSEHGLLADFANPTASGTALPDWIRQMLEDDPGWTTLGLPSP